MDTLRTLVTHGSLAAALALLGAATYLYIGGQRAQAQAQAFCDAVQPGESASRVHGRLAALPAQVASTTGQHSLAVVFGHGARHVCAIRFAQHKVASKVLTGLD